MIGGGPARPQRGRQGPEDQALGEDLARAGLAGGRRISRARPACRAISTSSASTSSASAAPPASAIPARCPTTISKAINDNDLVAVRGALGQPQFRGPREPGRARQLSGLAAAGRRLCARRLDAGRPRRRSRSGIGSDGKPVYLQRHLAVVGGDRRSSSSARSRSELFKSRYADVFTGDEQLAGGHGRGRPDLQVGHGFDLCAEPALFRGHDARSPKPIKDIVERAHPRPVPRFDHHRPHLARRLDPRRSRPAGQYLHRAPGRA